MVPSAVQSVSIVCGSARNLEDEDTNFGINTVRQSNENVPSLTKSLFLGVYLPSERYFLEVQKI